MDRKTNYPVSLTVKIEEETSDLIKRASEASGKSQSYILRDAIKKHCRETIRRASKEKAKA